MCVIPLGCLAQAALSPLHAASAADDVGAAEAALAAGCAVDLRDGEGATPLHWAADRGALKVCGILAKSLYILNAEIMWIVCSECDKCGQLIPNDMRRHRVIGSVGRAAWCYCIAVL